MTVDTIGHTDIQTVTKVRKMPMYRVLFHNDDKTTWQFVMAMLIRIFNKTPERAQEITAEVHKKGIGLAGIYALEHAELKRDQTISHARTNRFPLHVSIEPND